MRTTGYWLLQVLPFVLLAALVATMAVDLPQYQSLRRATFDTYQDIRPRQAPKDGPAVVVVEIDQESQRRLGPWPWPRSRVASLFEKLNTFGARATATLVRPLSTRPERAAAFAPAAPAVEGTGRHQGTLLRLDESGQGACQRHRQEALSGRIPRHGPCPRQAAGPEDEHRCARRHCRPTGQAGGRGRADPAHPGRRRRDRRSAADPAARAGHPAPADAVSDRRAHLSFRPCRTRPPDPEDAADLPRPSGIRANSSSETAGRSARSTSATSRFRWMPGAGFPCTRRGCTRTAGSRRGGC